MITNLVSTLGVEKRTLNGTISDNDEPLSLQQIERKRGDIHKIRLLRFGGAQRIRGK